MICAIKQITGSTLNGCRDCRLKAGSVDERNAAAWLDPHKEQEQEKEKPHPFGSSLQKNCGDRICKNPEFLAYSWPSAIVKLTSAEALGGVSAMVSMRATKLPGSTSSSGCHSISADSPPTIVVRTWAAIML